MIMATNMDISYRQGIRSKGFAITAATGITQQTLSLSGLAKSFEGISPFICFYRNAADGDQPKTTAYHAHDQ
jgi:hypothetical protein